jgi:hypothetical protein
MAPFRSGRPPDFLGKGFFHAHEGRQIRGAGRRSGVRDGRRVIRQAPKARSGPAKAAANGLGEAALSSEMAESLGSESPPARHADSLSLPASTDGGPKSVSSKGTVCSDPAGRTILRLPPPHRLWPGSKRHLPDYDQSDRCDGDRSERPDWTWSPPSCGVARTTPLSLWRDRRPSRRPPRDGRGNPRLSGRVWIDEIYRFDYGDHEGIRIRRRKSEERPTPGGSPGTPTCRSPSTRAAASFWRCLRQARPRPARTSVERCLEGPEGPHRSPDQTITHDGPHGHTRRRSSRPSDRRTTGLQINAPGDEASLKAKMAPMNNSCSYLRFNFEKHRGIKFAKLAAYRDLFMDEIPPGLPQYGFRPTIDYLFSRVCRHEK